MNPTEQEYLRSQFKVLNARLDSQDQVLTAIDHTINGNGKPGLKVEVDRLNRGFRLAKRVAWIVATPILAAVGTGAVAATLYLIRTIKESQ